jgi:hypothetical protein
MRGISALGAAGLFAFATTVAAQSKPATTTDDHKLNSKEMTITGCVEKTKSGGYFLTETAERSTPATTTGTSGATSTTTDTRSDKRSADHRMTWNLGQSDRIAQFVGHEVQVMGHPKGGKSGDELKGTTGEKEIHARDFDVKSVKSIASSCR